MRTLFTIMLLGGAGYHSAAQTNWESCPTEEFSKAIIRMEQAVMDKSSYSYQTYYSFFDQLDAAMPVLQESGLLICEKGERLYIEQFGKTIIQDKEVQVEVDPLYQTIVLRDPLEAYFKPQTSNDFSMLEMPGAAVKKKMVGDTEIFQVSLPKGQDYEMAEITAGGAMGITKYVLYARQTKIENEDGLLVDTRPRMEVTYKNFRKGNQVNTDRMKTTADYLDRKGDVLTLNAAYQDYELIDLRSQPK